MSTLPFIPEQFAKRPSTALEYAELKKWLIGLVLDERVAFIKQLWLVNYPFALTLLQASQMPISETEKLFRYWLQQGQHNAAKKLIEHFVPMLGEKKFWRIASEEQLSPAMRDFLNYYSNGRLNEL